MPNNSGPPAAQRPPHRREARTQEVREDDVRDARGAQLVQSARGLVPVEVLLRRRARRCVSGAASSRSAAYHSSSGA